jgi:hypothetical protein
MLLALTRAGSGRDTALIKRRREAAQRCQAVRLQLGKDRREVDRAVSGSRGHLRGHGQVAALHLFPDRMSELGQFLPPTFSNAMEELASTPDAEARNRYTPF